jgi:hypothetical protein
MQTASTSGSTTADTSILLRSYVQLLLLLYGDTQSNAVLRSADRSQGAKTAEG